MQKMIKSVVLILEETSFCVLCMCSTLW
jgi:hypothetical protein